MRTFLLLFLLFISAKIFSQTFEHSYGGALSETATSIQHTLDGNYVIGGASTSFTTGANDFYLVKVDPQGAVLWSKSYGTTADELSYYMNICSDGGFVLSGLTGNFPNRNVYVVRTDSDGNLQWSTSVGGAGDDFGWYVLEANDGGYIITGATDVFSSGDYDGYLVKLNSAGALQWTKVYTGTGADFLYAIQKTNDGGYIVTGEISSTSSGNTDMWLLKLNSNADTIWTRIYGKATEDAGNAVKQTADGGYIIAGDSHTFPNAGAHRAALVKTDSNGNMQWSKVYGSYPGSEIAYDVTPASDKGYFLLANTGFYGKGSHDILLIKADSTGKKIWAKTYGSNGDDDVWLFQQSTDGGFMMAAVTNSFGAGQSDFYLVKTDSLGMSACNVTSPDPFDTTTVLQTKSGTTIISGGVGTTVSSTSMNANSITTDWCMVGINEAGKKDEIKIYPNPSSDGKFILTGIKSSLQIKVYNILGENIFSTTLNSNKETINLPKQNGIYFYKITGSENEIGAGKIIIE